MEAKGSSTLSLDPETRLPKARSRKTKDPSEKAREALASFLRHNLGGEIDRIFNQEDVTKNEDWRDEVGYKKPYTSKAIKTLLYDKEDEDAEDETPTEPTLQDSKDPQELVHEFQEFLTPEISASLNALKDAKTKQEFDKRAVQLVHAIYHFFFDGKNLYSDLLSAIPTSDDPDYPQETIFQVMVAYLKAVLTTLVNPGQSEQEFQVWLKEFSPKKILGDCIASPPVKLSPETVLQSLGDFLAENKSLFSSKVSSKSRDPRLNIFQKSKALESKESDWNFTHFLTDEINYKLQGLKGERNKKSFQRKVASLIRSVYRLLVRKGELHPVLVDQFKTHFPNNCKDPIDQGYLSTLTKSKTVSEIFTAYLQQCFETLKTPQNEEWLKSELNRSEQAFQDLLLTEFQRTYSFVNFDMNVEEISQELFRQSSTLWHEAADDIANSHFKTAAVTAISKYQQRVTRLVETQLLYQSSLSDRSAIMAKWIDITYKCFELGDYCTVRALMTAFHGCVIRSMETAEASLKPDAKEKLTFLKAINYFSGGMQPYQKVKFILTGSETNFVLPESVGTLELFFGETAERSEGAKKSDEESNSQSRVKEADPELEQKNAQQFEFQAKVVNDPLKLVGKFKVTIQSFKKRKLSHSNAGVADSPFNKALACIKRQDEVTEAEIAAEQTKFCDAEAKKFFDSCKSPVSTSESKVSSSRTERRGSLNPQDLENISRAKQNSEGNKERSCAAYLAKVQEASDKKFSISGWAKLWRFGRALNAHKKEIGTVGLITAGFFFGVTIVVSLILLVVSTVKKVNAATDEGRNRKARKKIIEIFNSFAAPAQNPQTVPPKIGQSNFQRRGSSPAILSPTSRAKVPSIPKSGSSSDLTSLKRAWAANSVTGKPAARLEAKGIEGPTGRTSFASALPDLGGGLGLRSPGKDISKNAAEVVQPPVSGIHPTLEEQVRDSEKANEVAAAALKDSPPDSPDHSPLHTPTGSPSLEGEHLLGKNISRAESTQVSEDSLAATTAFRPA